MLSTYSEPCIHKWRSSNVILLFREFHKLVVSSCFSYTFPAVCQWGYCLLCLQNLVYPYQLDLKKLFLDLVLQLVMMYGLVTSARISKYKVQDLFHCAYTCTHWLWVFNEHYIMGNFNQQISSLRPKFGCRYWIFLDLHAGSPAQHLALCQFCCPSSKAGSLITGYGLMDLVIAFYSGSGDVMLHSWAIHLSQSPADLTLHWGVTL